MTVGGRRGHSLQLYCAVQRRKRRQSVCSRRGQTAVILCSTITIVDDDRKRTVFTSQQQQRYIPDRRCYAISFTRRSHREGTVTAYHDVIAHDKMKQCLLSSDCCNTVLTNWRLMPESICTVPLVQSILRETYRVKCRCLR